MILYKWMSIRELNYKNKRGIEPHHIAKNKYRKSETNIPRKGIARPQSQCPHSCVCERFIYSRDRFASFCCRKYVDRSWEYINCSQTTHERGLSRAIPRKGIHKWDFPCIAHPRGAGGCFSPEHLRPFPANFGVPEDDGTPPPPTAQLGKIGSPWGTDPLGLIPPPPLFIGCP
jgi:hypothetical protein